MIIPDLEMMFEKMVDAVYLIDPQSSNIIWSNRAGYEGIGFEKSEILDHSVLSLQKDVHGMPSWADVREVIFNNDAYTFVGRHVHKEGGEVAVEVVTSHFASGGDQYFLSVARNVNKRLALEKDMKDRNSRIRFALNETTDGLWEWEVNTGHVFFSPQLKKMLGYGPEEMTPHLSTWQENVHPNDLNRTIQILNDHIEGRRERYDAEYRLKNRNGHYIWVHDQGKICERDAQGNPTHIVGMVQNITDRKALQSQLEDLADLDMLTKLQNRRKGTELTEYLLDLSRRGKQSLSIAVIDFDFFKRVNDIYGHQKGDEALILGAELLQATIRASDMLCRWGGEEFVVSFPNTALEQVTVITSKLHQAFKNADWSAIGMEPLTMSIGVANYPLHGDDFETLFKEADDALYLAKERGRDCTVFAELANNF